MKVWKALEHKGYTAVAVKVDANTARLLSAIFEDEPVQWFGDFKYPIRRGCHSFAGNTLEEVRKSFEEGVDAYHAHIKSQGDELEPEGMEGIESLLAFEMHKRSVELGLLHFPANTPQELREVMKEMMMSSNCGVEYNQAAVDEFTVLLKRCVSHKEFAEWADRVWKQGRLDRTPSGLRLSKLRDARIEELSGDLRECIAKPANQLK
jgi:predicted RNase H-like HicB family nuclease